MTSFRILGPVEAGTGGRSVPLGGRRQLRLLAFLVLNGNRAVSSDALIDAVWGPSTSATDHRLQMAIARLRKALAAADGSDGRRVRTVGGGYLLSLELGELDAEVFEALLGEGRRALEAGEPARAAEALDQAFGLWRGPPLAEVAFEDFAQPEIRRLEELRLDALEARIEARLLLGRHAELIGELESLLAKHPSRERLAAQLMLALYRCGRQAEALEVYQRTRVHLAQELGLEPGATLRTMQDQILHQAPSLEVVNLSSPRAEPVDAWEGSADLERLVGPPVAPTLTIGRQREIERVCELLESREAQLVTLTGPGGVGKTRVALAVAHAMQATMPGGVGWVELAGVGRAEDVVGAVAQVLRTAPSPGESVVDALRRHIAGKRFVLVVDNFEHVLDAAVLVAELLAASPGLSVLATSREPLDLASEHRVLIAPLALPDASEGVTVTELEATDATALFLAAARRRDERFQPTPADAAIIARICARLEGLPLALELAAARAGALGVPALAARVDTAIGELGAGPRDAPARQQTLRATLDWSYRLLDSEQARALVRFAVFAGGATLDAAQAVIGTTAETLEALVAKNLIFHRAQPDGSGRLLMLDTIREYALERLTQDAEHGQLRRRHGEWFLALAKRTDDRMRSSERSLWLARLDAETENLRAALAWSLDHDVPQGVELASTLFEPWAMHGRTHELIAWFERVLASPAAIGVPTRAVALKTYGQAVDIAERHELAREVFQESLTLFRKLGDRRAEADVLAELALAALEAGWGEERIGSDQDGIGFGEAALAISRELQYRAGIQRALNILGAGRRDDPTQAAAMLEEALAIAHERDDRYETGSIMHSLGDLALERNDPEQAAHRYRNALQTAADLGDERLEAYCTAGLACVAALRGEILAAGQLWATAEAMEDRLGRRLEPTSRKRYERILIPLAEHEQFRDGRQAGGDSRLDEALGQLALG